MLFVLARPKLSPVRESSTVEKESKPFKSKMSSRKICENKYREQYLHFELLRNHIRTFFKPRAKPVASPISSSISKIFKITPSFFMR